MDLAADAIDEKTAYGVPQNYVDALASVDAAVVILPPVASSAAAVTRLDGLVLSGGSDIHPSRYGASSLHPTLRLSDRDEAELAVLRAALAAGMPVLGVCRGLQLLAVHFGGTLHQHLPDAIGHDGHSPGNQVGSHQVRFAPDSVFAEIYGAGLVVNSFHHQGVLDTGELIACAWAEDGLVEGVRHPEKPLVCGVQWHPEKDSDGRRLFRWFVEALAGASVPRQQMNPGALRAGSGADVEEINGHRP